MTIIILHCLNASIKYEKKPKKFSSLNKQFKKK